MFIFLKMKFNKCSIVLHMEEYRNEARKRYENKIEKERIEQEQQRERIEQEQQRERIEQELREREQCERELREQEQIDQERERIEHEQQELDSKREFTEQWMIWMTLLTEDILHSLHELTLLVEKIPMSQDYLYECMVELVEQLNSIQETRKIDATEARLIHEAMLKLIQMTKIDIEIQPMDTSQDEDYARHVEHRELEQLQEQVQHHGLGEIEQLGNELPICSIERRLGLNVAQLREIARMHDIKIKGNKRELCLILSRHGLVRLV
jgi:hypothetical protein